MSSAASTGSTAQGGSKAAICGEEHSSPNATRQQKARAHVMATRHKRSVSELPSPSTNVSTRQDGEELATMWDKV